MPVIMISFLFRNSACSSLAFANCDDCSDANSAGVAVCNDCSNGFILDFWQTVCLCEYNISFIYTETE